MKDASDIIAAFGGSWVVAEILEVSTPCVCMMRTRNYIAVNHWPALIRAARNRKIKLSAARLMRMFAERKCN